MTLPIRLTALALLLVLAPALLGQSLFFGDAVPQPHTRYGAVGAEPLLTTNGQHVFLAWATDSKVRITRLVDGEKRAGRPVLDADYGWFDAVWTGTHFLVVAYNWRVNNAHQIRGRLVNASGEPVGEAFPILAELGRPRLAFHGGRVLMVYGPPGGEVYSLLLRPDGTQATEPRHQVISPWLSNEGVVVAGATGFVAASAMVDRVRITTFQPNGEVAGAPQFTLPPVAERRVALGSNGQDVLAVWTNGSGAAEWTRVRANGTISGRSAIGGTEGATAAAVAWSGGNWVVSTIGSGQLRTHLIEATTGTPVLTPAPAHEHSPVSLVTLQGQTFAAWRGSGSGRSVLVRNVAASNNGQTAAFAAAEQTLLAATSSYDAALAVWSDFRDGRRTLHAGVRTESGGWRESRIGEDEDVPVAGSDGNLFMVVKKTSSGWSAVMLDNAAQIVANTPTVTSFTPTGMAWNGTAWVVIGVSAQSNVYAVKVMPWGTVSAPVLISERRGTRELENPRIVWGDGGYFAVWRDSESVVCFPVCDPYESVLHGTRLTESLQRIDTQNLELAPDEAVSPDVFWDGNRYVIFWVNDGALETRTMRPNAAGSGIARIAGVQIDTGELRAIRTAAGVAITSNDGEVLLVRDGILVTRYHHGRASSTDALVTLGDKVAYLQTSVRDEMPYHGAARLFLRVGGLVPPDYVPDPPQIVRATMTNGGNLMIVQWTPPVDPVNGYRVEYRVNDGAWNELDQWFDAGTTSISIRPWLDNAHYQFRIRAWSDAGVTGYSRPATVRLLARRRAVR